VEGARFALMSTIVLAGIFHVEEALPALVDMGHDMEGQYALLLKEIAVEGIPEHYAFLIWTMSHARNKAVLTGAVAEAMRAVEAERGMKGPVTRLLESDSSLKFRTHALTAWDAEVAPYDQIHTGYNWDVDYSKGKYELSLLVNVSPEDRKKIFAAAVKYLAGLPQEQTKP
jgi:hypothetical protein